MACNCPHDVKGTPPAPKPPRYAVIAASGRSVYQSTDEESAHVVAERYPGSHVTTLSAD
ncbi:hypothetical protein OV450_1362 [Actinobacteria bacterium OV450]|nr:hypothetical protein OV450_1362 [Actinobacteria bacterium OV450]